MISPVLKYGWIYGFVLLATACGQEEIRQAPQKITAQKAKEPLIRDNIRHAQKESDEIDQYIQYRGWEMKNTGTGLRYRIYKEGNGEKAEYGKRAKVNYKITLLDGTVCYTSEKKGSKEFVIGEDHVESGVHEGVSLLHVGDKAVFIIPSHLAHGLVGDDFKIPPRATIVVDVELLSIR